MAYDIIVVGGGHAGIEAAHIGAKRGMKTLLVTINVDLIGQMSCNPAIGGIAKGNLVREIDALGGIMAKIIDKTGIHFRMLNKSKGGAVWGNRAQADKPFYRRYARKLLEKLPLLYILQGSVVELITSGNKINGVILDSGETVKAKAVILAMGTFLNGVAHVGLNHNEAGRSGEPPSKKLSESIQSLGITAGRLKTGTPPRIDGRTVDYGKLTEQKGDDDPWPFSFNTKEPIKNKIVCWTGKTNKETHKIIKENLDRSPLYTGKIKSIGPRYCPSIEDKVVRFGERDGHTLFLEPESCENKEMYLNGLSTSLPFDVQIKMVKTIPGLENACIIRPGYGIEYDFFQPLQLHPTLESKNIENLYFTGQINGTSGYEEAACQGLIAGMNASQKITGNEEIVLGRDTSYIGVLIDDLITRGTEEPYRMFTSRAEYRLLLRQDNCDERLMPIAAKHGYIDQNIYDERRKLWDRKKNIIEYLEKVRVEPNEWNEIEEEKIKKVARGKELLRRPKIFLNALERYTEKKIDDDIYVRLGVEWDIKYEGFVQKQKAEIERMKSYEYTKIPDEFNYDEVQGLLAESKLKFKNNLPRTLGQASRIPGVTPADITILALYIVKNRKSSTVSRETVEM